MVSNLVGSKFEVYIIFRLSSIALTHAFSCGIQAKVTGATSYAGQFSGYDEYVPMVDKAVDSVLKKQASMPKPSIPRGSGYNFC